ncbi:23S rRNA (cytidine1920-2'-O)/16S rRNA (cytidine1409-2'-O)-methyltransferase [Ancylobacter aquaticus]|uniref:23S rRNA (Cytidine1920-2'-O)/16S rRNA (Cytidine1409-2'-O)-methyltransferase n=1 Tax=Ancylobacter aquaticus TaxID=100 RepID=A0A4V2PJZ7_ANCAQ|nr:TlyA family RNA methyltransferase [Ancylobacter aquaticus]TCK30476.1 23S rRNA (cytidine1920-2'-O)/16S rRNA (cytidine1409-2'-O)-methyltransferase [Ancylobacter aquaticus]
MRPPSSAKSPAPSPRRDRADRVLVERGIFDSRARAQAAIEAGLVTADGKRVAKPSETIFATAAIEAREAYEWVSRAGLKLEAALDVAGLCVKGLEALDVGASTGGFTQVLLARGAVRVHAVDVGRGQLHERLRGDARVVSLEETDIRSLAPGAVPVADIVTVDVSFISLQQILPALLPHQAAEARLVALVKPQFEVGRDKLSKGGIVKDEGARAEAVSRIEALLGELGWKVTHRLVSPILGGDGNEECLLVAARAA